MNKKIFAAAFGFVLLLAAAFAIHADGPGFRHRMGRHGDMAEHHEHVAKTLGLSEEQRAAAKKIHEEVAAKAEPLQEQIHQQWKEIHEMLDSGSADATAIGQRMISAHATRQELKTLHEEAMSKFSALLNAEQLEKFKKLHERHEHDGVRRMHGFGHGF